MEQNKQDQLASLLPDHSNESDNFATKSNQERAANFINTAHDKLTASEIAKMKREEIQRLKRTQSGSNQYKKDCEQEKKQLQQNIEELEVIENSPEAMAFLAGEGHSDLSPYAGTTKRDVVKMLDQLGINLNLYLSRADTYNLLSCLLTCNEAQLDAIYNNSKTPLAIKTVIKRLQQDSQLGNIETIEKLWDRIFGKADKVKLDMQSLGLLQQQVTQQPGSIQNGIIPNTVVSREAYTIIRDTIIGN